MKHLFFCLFFFCPFIFSIAQNQSAPNTVRLILYGGAREIDSVGNPHKLGITHNNTFGNAAFRLKKEYLKRKDAKIKVVKVENGKEIVDIINKQAENSIISLDILSHSDIPSLNMSRAEHTNCGIYTTSVGQHYVARIYKHGYHFVEDSRSVYDINFSRFSDSVIIELHGCKSADETLLCRNISKHFSLCLRKWGKKEAIVIGHHYKSTPEMKKYGAPITDYRNHKRAVYYRGHKFMSTNREGNLVEWLRKKIRSSGKK